MLSLMSMIRTHVNGGVNVAVTLPILKKHAKHENKRIAKSATGLVKKIEAAHEAGAIR